jgi:hypothetical protein
MMLLDLADLVNDDDVRMVERRGRARLLLKAAHALSVACELLRQQLDGHPAAQPRVAGQIDFAHPAATQTRENLIVIEAAADQCGYLLCG